MEIFEPSRKLSIVDSVDLVVVGGGCTGVLSAVRAARLGLKVALIERNGCLGGVATTGLVNIWHTLLDTDYKEQIIFGLTAEVEEMLLKENAATIENTEYCGMRFNPNQMILALDKLVTNEKKIHTFFHAFYSSILLDGNTITHVVIDTKEGRVAIETKFVIDASGDGDVCRDLRLPSYRYSNMQPPSSCSILQVGDVKNYNLGELVLEHGKEFNLDDDWGWGGSIPGLPTLTFRADNHVFGVDCSKNDELTFSEFEGRRKSKAISDLLKTYVDPKYELASLASSIGIRDTVHYVTNYKVTERDLLTGKKFENTIAKGTYRLDVHHQGDNGITFKYLNGKTETIYGKMGKIISSTWKDEYPEIQEFSKYYSIPWETLVQSHYTNFIAVGRMVNAEESAFGAIRVMVNLNQMGEAAAIGSALALNQNLAISDLDGSLVSKIIYQ